MTVCAVRGCQLPADTLATREGIARAVCAEHAAAAREQGYALEPLAGAARDRALAELRDAARDRARAETAYRTALNRARAEGASYGRIARAAGLSRTAAFRACTDHTAHV